MTATARLPAATRGVETAADDAWALAAGTDAHRIRRIVVAVDGSRGASRALSRAARIARTHRAEVSLVHVAPRHGGAADAVNVARRILEDAVTFLAKEGVEAEGVLRAGTLAEELHRAAADRDADLVILGSSDARGTRASPTARPTRRPR